MATESGKSVSFLQEPLRTFRRCSVKNSLPLCIRKVEDPQEKRPVTYSDKRSVQVKTNPSKTNCAQSVSLASALAPATKVDNCSGEGELLSLEQELKNFMASKQSLLCIIADQFEVNDYKVLDHILPEEGRVFMGSDQEVCLEKDRIRTASYIIIDYTQLTQPDCVNHLLESCSKTTSKKVIGIVSKKDYGNMPQSLQSRWSKYCVVSEPSGKHSVHLEKESRCRNTIDIDIYGTHHKLANLDKLTPSELREKQVRLIGVNPSDPCVMYRVARVENKGGSVTCLSGTTPIALTQVSSIKSVANCRLIHGGNFEELNGGYLIQSHIVVQGDLPKKVCIISSLKDYQWWQLGAFMKEHPDVSVSVIPEVDVPEDTEVSLYQDNEKTPEETCSIKTKGDLNIRVQTSQESIWIQSEDLVGEDVCAGIDGNVKQCSIRPKMPFDKLLGSVKETADGLCYQPSEWSQWIQDPESVIVIDNVECNPWVSLALEAMCVSRSVRQNGKVLDVRAKIIIISRKRPTAMPSLKADWGAVDNGVETVEKLTATESFEKQKSLHHMLDTQVVYEIRGAGNSGKTHWLRDVLSERQQSACWISCSPNSQVNEVERQLLEWLQGNQGSVLVIDHYNVMPDGFWSNLVPNHNNKIIIDGKPYKIPKGHVCVLIENSFYKSHHMSKYLPRVTFNAYTRSEIINVVNTFEGEHSDKQWCLDVYNAMQKVLGHRLQITDLMEIYGWYQVNLKKEEVEKEQAMANALYLYASLFREDFENVILLGKSLPVVWESWIEASRAIKRGRNRLDDVQFTQDQEWIQAILTNHLTLKKRQRHPVVWVQGGAGCGKDFVVDHVLKTLKREYVRVKGSNMHQVLLAAKEAKRDGKVLVIEEADLMCPKVLESLVESTNPEFSIIATVNGMSYAGRQPTSPGVLSKSLVLNCREISDEDLRRVLEAKYKDTDMTTDDIDFLIAEYALSDIFISPREIYSVIDEYLDSETLSHDVLRRYWSQKMAILRQFRPRIQSYGSRGVVKGFESIKHKKTKAKPSKEKGELKIKGRVTSGIGKSEISVVGTSTHDYLGVRYFVVNREGGQIRVSSGGLTYDTVSDGMVCIKNVHRTSLLCDVNHQLGCILPIPTGTVPVGVVVGDGGDAITETQVGDLGDYAIIFPRKVKEEKFYLAVKYKESDQVEYEFNSSESVSAKCYKQYKLVVSGEVKECLMAEFLCPDQKLERVYSIFRRMTYDDSKEAAKLYKGLKGEGVVNQFLKTKRGVCFEAAEAFAAVVSHYLGYNVRRVSGFYCKEDRLMSHSWVEVEVEGKWKLFDPTPTSRVDGGAVSEPVINAVDQNKKKNKLWEKLKRQGSRQISSGEEKSKRKANLEEKEDEAWGGFITSVEEKFREKEKCEDEYQIEVSREEDRIRKHCYEKGFLRSGVRLGYLPSAEGDGCLDLSVWHDTQKRVYGQVFAEKGEPFPYMEVTLYKGDENPARVQALLNMKMPVFMALANPKRVERVLKVDNIPWRELEWKLKADSTDEGAVDNTVGKLYSDPGEKIPKKKRSWLTTSMLSESFMMSVNLQEEIGLEIGEVDNLEYCIEFLSKESSQTYLNKIVGIKICHPRLLKRCFQDYKHLLIRLVQLCPNINFLDGAWHVISPKDELPGISEKIERLRVLCQNLNEEDVDRLVQYMSPNLQDFSLGGCEISAEGLNKLLKNLPKTVKYLNLELIRLDGKRLRDIVENIPLNLKILDVSDNQLNLEDLQFLKSRFPHTKILNRSPRTT